MEDTQGFCTLDSIIRDECLAQGDLNLSLYMRYMSFALEGLRDWTYDHKSEVKVLSLMTSAIATLPYPADYVKWSRIGTVIGDRIKTMIANNRLALSHELDSCGQPVNNPPYHPSYLTGIVGSPNILNDNFYSYNMNYGDSSGAIYGFGNGGYLNDGQFRVDDANRRFQFSSDMASKPIYLEYVGTGLNPTGQTVVNENARKSIKFYIRWQVAETNKNESMNVKTRAEDQYWKENMTATKRVTVDLDKILSIHREAHKLTSKT